MSAAPTADGQEILYQVVDDHIAVVTLNRPEARNAMSLKMALAIDGLVTKIDADPNIRVAIIRSSDPRAFCAGADLSDVALGLSPVIPERGFGGFAEAPKTKPWIAAISGWALGGGFEIALACDMVVAAAGSRMGLPEVKRGLMSGSGVWRLPNRLPANIAKELIVTGESISAEEAHAWGLVNRIVAVDSLLEETLELARKVATASPTAVRESLNFVKRGTEPTDSEIAKKARSASDQLRTSADGLEGARAFIEKRDAKWANV